MLFDVFVAFVPIFFSIVLHEIAHGYAALAFGDDTAERYGRLSLNPINHVDIVGTIALPLILWLTQAPFLFGWARPVPVNFMRLRNRRIGVFVVASAGVIVNAVLAIIALLVLKNFELDVYCGLFFKNLLLINLALIFLNILPIPPLDGSKMLFGWMDNRLAKRYVAAEYEGLFGLMVLIIAFPLLGQYLGFKELEQFNPLGIYMQKMFELVLG